MFRVTTRRKGKDIERSLERLRNGDYLQGLEGLAQAGVDILQRNTPVDTGLTASSWYYTITPTRKGPIIWWCNSNIVGGSLNVAVLLQYGHGTGTGGYVQGLDYINPAMRPAFNKISDEVWRLVKDV